MILKVIKRFNGKDEGKILNPGDVVVTSDLDRINALVGRGLCVITSVGEDKKADEKSAKISFQQKEYSLDEVKDALNSIGVQTAKNAGATSVAKKLDELTIEQGITLSERLNKEG